MKERIATICLLLLAGLTIWAITAELQKKPYAQPASDFTEAVRNGAITPTSLATHNTSASPSVADEVIRLHILADSDSEQDQAIKLALRDVLLPYINAATLGAESKAEALVQLNAQSPALTEIANSFLAWQNTGYTADISVKQIYFPIRIYGSQTYLSKDAVIFPPGYYDSVQVILGSGEGHNWWCLAYPSLCFIDSSYDYIPKDSDLYKVKIGTVKKGHLEKLFYGETFSGLISETYPEMTLDESEDVTIYFGSKLWELLKSLFS